jgi:hypothetical protein
VDYAAWCPTYEILSGGGFYRTLYPTGAGEPMTANWLVSGSQQEWHASYDNTGVQEGSLNDWADMWSQEYAVCVDLKAASGRVSITFSNYHHLIRIPADVIVATDGSGEVKAQTVTVRVGQAQSAPIEAVKTTNPFTGGVSYVVPAGCGDPTPANTAATAALKQALRGKVPTGQVAFGNPAVTLDSASLTCTPTAGTSRTAPFTYTQAIDGSASQSAYAPTDVLTYQLAQLTKAAVATGSQYALRDTLICPTGPQIASATATKATVTCAAYGVAEWQWSADALQALARSLAGKSQADALQLLDATPGIDAGSAVIRLSHGGTLPTDPSKIALSVGRLQDTPPVVRTP